MTVGLYTPRGIKPRQPESLWHLRKPLHTLEAQLRYHGESYGVELQILRDGELLFGATV